jgi:SAM-dependent methyltransferase
MALFTRQSEAPDRQAALAQYRARASVYDLELALFEPLRRRAVELLNLRAGQTVLDLACGTGLSLELLQRHVGAGGHIVGIEQSPEMLARAHERLPVGAQAHGWPRVTLLCSPVETAAIAVQADAALFHFTHDVLRNRAAVHHVLQHLRPGARVVACGLKWAGPWAWPVNLLVWPAALRSVSSMEGLDAPWSHLEAALGGLRVHDALFGGVYLAEGTVPGLPARRTRHRAP